MNPTRPPHQLLAAGAMCCISALLAACARPASTLPGTSLAPLPTAAESTTTVSTITAATSTDAPPSSSTTVAATTAPATAQPTTPEQQTSIAYEHPELGPVTIEIGYPEPAEGDLITPTVRATADATGETLFEWTGYDGYISFGFAGTTFNPNISNPVDKLGHVFFEWDPGRYPGVSYLIPTPTGFDPNGTMGDAYSDGHYEALIVDEGGDGTYEIKQGFTNCEPSCADGYVYSHIWTWDGTAYTGSDTDPGRDAAVPLGDVSQLEPAKDAFIAYLETAGARDYAEAWDMLDPTYQEKYGSYDKFTAFWDTIDSVGIEDLEASWGYGYTTLEGTLWFELKDGTRQREQVIVAMAYGDPPKVANYFSVLEPG